jgi:hypothetical protein
MIIVVYFIAVMFQRRFVITSLKYGELFAPKQLGALKQTVGVS